MYFVIVILLLLFSSLTIILSKSYLSVPVYELKRRSKLGDKLSKDLYLVASYERTYSIFNKVLILLLSTFFYIIAVTKSSGIFAFILVLLYTFLVFFWLPRTKQSRLSDYLASLSAKPLKLILSYLNPLILKFHRSTSPHKRYGHTGIFEESDIYHFIDQQKSQEDSRVEGYALDVIKSVLDFNKSRVLAGGTYRTT
jgi:CBS domain containing-hemolysin-like protein